jgi:hypothetical protein
MLYIEGYYSQRVAFASHLSSQKYICDPSFNRERSIAEEKLLRSHESRPEVQATKFPDNPGQRLRINIFFFRRVYQKPSLISSLKSHLPRRDDFLTWRSWTPSPPWSLGLQTILHLTSRYLFFLPPLIDNNRACVKHILARGRNISYTVPC